MAFILAKKQEDGGKKVPNARGNYRWLVLLHIREHSWNSIPLLCATKWQGVLQQAPHHGSQLCDPGLRREMREKNRSMT